MFIGILATIVLGLIASILWLLGFQALAVAPLVVSIVVSLPFLLHDGYTYQASFVVILSTLFLSFFAISFLKQLIDGMMKGAGELGGKAAKNFGKVVLAIVALPFVLFLVFAATNPEQVPQAQELWDTIFNVGAFVLLGLFILYKLKNAGSKSKPQGGGGHH